jgi:hypothetical protein
MYAHARSYNRDHELFGKALFSGLCSVFRMQQKNYLYNQALSPYQPARPPLMPPFIFLGAGAGRSGRGVLVKLP